MDRCERLLARGVFDTLTVDTHDKFRTVFEHFLFKSTEEEAEKIIKSGAKVPLPQIKMTPEGHLDANDFKKWKQSVAERYSGEHFSDQELSVINSRASAKLSDAYVNCVRGTASGVHCFATANGETDIIFSVVCFPRGKNPPPVINVTDSAVTNAHRYPPKPDIPDGQIFADNEELGYDTTSVIMVRENPELGCSFTVNTEELGSDSDKLPPAITTPPQQEFILLMTDIKNRKNIEVGVAPSAQRTATYPDPAMHNAAPWHLDKPAMAEWIFNSPATAWYEVLITYAAALQRPMELWVNDRKIKDDAVGTTTGGWEPYNRAELSDGFIPLVVGTNKLRLESKTVPPHISRIRLAWAPNIRLKSLGLPLEYLDLA